MRHTTYRSVLAKFAVLAALAGVGACDGHVTQLQPTEAEIASGLQTGHEALEGLASQSPLPCLFERPEYDGFVYLYPDPDDILPPNLNTIHFRQIVDMWHLGGPPTPLPTTDVPDYIRWTCPEDIHGPYPTLADGTDTPTNPEGFVLELLDRGSPETVVDWFLTYPLHLVTPDFGTRHLFLVLMSAEGTAVAIAPVEVRYCERPEMVYECIDDDLTPD